MEAQRTQDKFIFVNENIFCAPVKGPLVAKLPFRIVTKILKYAWKNIKDTVI